MREIEALQVIEEGLNKCRSRWTGGASEGWEESSFSFPLIAHLLPDKSWKSSVCLPDSVYTFEEAFIISPNRTLFATPSPELVHENLFFQLCAFHKNFFLLSLIDVRTIPPKDPILFKNGLFRVV